MSKEPQAAKKPPGDGVKKTESGKAAPADPSVQPAKKVKTLAEGVKKSLSGGKVGPAESVSPPGVKTRLPGQVQPTALPSKPVAGNGKPAAPKPKLETVKTAGPAKEKTVTPVPSPVAPAAPASTAGADKAASVLGDYKLLKKLGQGGMGAVYKAQRSGEERIVAIKVLSRELSNKETYVQRFLREARVMEKLDHPNVLRCFGVDKHKNYYFIAMEYVSGGSIEGWLKKLGRFSIGDALHVVLKTAEALQHAHDKSLIHRDIKPDNILLTGDGQIKLADLGLAKDTDEENNLTKTGSGAGTPIYMAPEQARDVKHVDARVDIYALGIMLYVFLTGQPPFQGHTLVDVITAKEKGKFDPIRKFNDQVPPKLDLIVDKMLAKDPKHRYASCTELIADLTPLRLENDHLSFLAPEADAASATLQNPASATLQNLPKKTAESASAKKPAGATRGPGVVAAKTNIAEKDPVEKDIWYWNMPAQGKVIAKKLTTAQVCMLIKSGSIDVDAELSKTPKTGFRSIASYDEFQPLFRNKKTTTRANAKGNKYQQIYEDMEKEQKDRKRAAWLNRLVGSLFGLFWIFLILGGLIAVGWYVYKYTTFLR